MNKIHILKKEVNDQTVYFSGKLHDKITETTTDVTKAFEFTSHRSALNTNYTHLHGDYTIVTLESEINKRHE